MTSHQMSDLEFGELWGKVYVNLLGQFVRNDNGSPTGGPTVLLRDVRRYGDGDEGRHRRGKIRNWTEGMVIYNFSTELFDRVTLKINHSHQRATVMSWPLDPAEDEETVWRSY